LLHEYHWLDQNESRDNARRVANESADSILLEFNVAALFCVVSKSMVATAA